MNAARKTLGLSAILLLTVITTTLVARKIIEEKKRPAFDYRIQADDTCAKIAVDFNVSVMSIVKANRLKRDCSDIHVGQVLWIPYPTPTPLGSPVATSRNTTIDCDREIYTVKTGDTLEIIADKHSVSKDAIVFFNGLTREKLEAGTQLVIPLCYPTPTP